jgi:hypothetical protein
MMVCSFDNFAVVLSPKSGTFSVLERNTFPCCHNLYIFILHVALFETLKELVGDGTFLCHLVF